VYDAASDNLKCVQECFVSTDGQTSDPRASLAPAIEAVSAPAPSRRCSTACSPRPSRTRAFDGRDLRLRSGPPGPPARRVARDGPGRDGRLSTAVNDPADPFTTAAVTRIATFDREANGATARASSAPTSRWSSAVAASTPVLARSASAGRRPRALDSTEQETLTALAGLAALAIDRTRLASTACRTLRMVRAHGHTDPLTGLANERTVGRVLELELARAGRQGSEVSFAMFDVDDFRATNEEGGHEAGDDVLRRVAAVLAESVRLVDTVGRIGGDEFVWWLPARPARWWRDGSSTGSRHSRRRRQADHGLGRRGALPCRRDRRGWPDRGRH
jgi:GGDEF domain-containing protein